MVGLGVRWVGLGIRGWRLIGLGVGMGGFMDQEAEIGRFRGEMGGFRDQGGEIGRFRGEMGEFRDQGVEIDRFRGVGWVGLWIRRRRLVGLGVRWVGLGIRGGGDW